MTNKIREFFDMKIICKSHYLTNTIKIIEIAGGSRRWNFGTLYFSFKHMLQIFKVKKKRVKYQAITNKSIALGLWRIERWIQSRLLSRQRPLPRRQHFASMLHVWSFSNWKSKFHFIFNVKLLFFWPIFELKIILMTEILTIVQTRRQWKI